MAEEAVKEETVKEESVQAADSLDDMFGQSDPKSEVPVKGAEEKVETADTKPEEKSEDNSKAEEDKGSVSKDAKPDKAPSGVDWASDDNPLKKDLADKESQLKNTRDYATQVNQRNVELERGAAGLDRKIDVLGKKIDGTYDEESDKASAPTEAEIRSDESRQVRLKVSETLARDTYGSEKVDAALSEFQSRFGTNQGMQGRVLSSDSPVMEAIKVLKETAFMDKHGSDPEKIEESIRVKYEKELVKSITERVTKEIGDRYTKQGNDMQGLSEVKGSQDQKKPVVPDVEPLEDLF